MAISNIIRKVQRRVVRLFISPIHVFLFHQVSEVFDETTMKIGDWNNTEIFKSNIIKLKNKYTFISLPEAYTKIKDNKIRFKKYAVLTSDDGWFSLKNILPWLIEQKIPITLFVNPLYLDGKHFREKNTEKYLSMMELRSFDTSLVSIGSHGWEHINATTQSEDEFINSVEKSDDALKDLPNYIPFFCFTYGAYTQTSLKIVRDIGLIPVFIDGGKNYTDYSCIHRELIDGVVL